MKRYFYLAENDIELKEVAKLLEKKGVVKTQIHLITQYKGASYLDSLTPIHSSWKRLIIIKEIKLFLCLVIAMSISALGYLTETSLFNIVLLSVVTVTLSFFLLFATNKNVTSADPFDQRPIQNELESGKFLLLVELNDSQNNLLEFILQYPKIIKAGVHELV